MTRSQFYCIVTVDIQIAEILSCDSRIDNYPTSVWIPRRKVQDSITRALQMWGDVTPLDFRMLDDWDIDDEDADIYVSFSKYRHGDPYPFDGPDGTIAHAYLPNGQFGNLDGDVHFDDSEFFSYDGDSGNGGRALTSCSRSLKGKSTLILSRFY